MPDNSDILKALNDNMTVNGPQWNSNPMHMRNMPLDTPFGRMYKHLYDPKSVQFNPTGPMQAPYLDSHDMGQRLSVGGRDLGSRPGVNMRSYNANDSGPGLSGKMPPGMEAAMQHQQIVMQEQRATEMAAAAKRAQLLQVINPDAAIGAGMLPQGTGGGSVKRPWETSNE